jgi:hypothetical protein
MNGEPTDAKQDPESSFHMYQYGPKISQSLKEYIWIQLSLKQIAKEIYDRHKIIWWEHVKVGKAMTWDGFI